MSRTPLSLAHAEALQVALAEREQAERTRQCAEADFLEVIRSVHRAGGYSYAALGAALGFTKQHIAKICTTERET